MKKNHPESDNEMIVLAMVKHERTEVYKAVKPGSNRVACTETAEQNLPSSPHHFSALVYV